MNVLYIHADRKEEKNSVVWRCEKPARALLDTGHEAKVVFWQDMDFEAELEVGYDVVFFQRYCWKPAISQAQAFRDRGAVIVYDFDDDYHEINETNQGYEFWKEGYGRHPKTNVKIKLEPPAPIRWFDWMREEADIVTTPSTHLAMKYDARFLENMPELRNWKKMPRRRGDRKVIGWGGGSSHMESWRDSEIIRPLLDAALEKNWQIRIVGAPNVMELIGEHKARMKKVPVCSFRGFMPAAQWPRDLSTQFDLYVIPLAHEYDKARSPIKVLECSLAGVPWIATDNGVYEDFRSFGTLVKNDPNHWYEAITYSMDRNAAQRQASLSARNYVLRHYMIEDNVAHLLEAYTP